MFKQIFQRFRSRILSSGGLNESSIHFRSLFLLLLLALFCQQFFISGKVSALSVIPKIPKAPQTYIYVRTSPIIDDSWIGTLVNFTKKLPETTVLTGSTQTTVLNTTNIIHTTNTQWVDDWKQSIDIIEGDRSTIEFNSAPLLESMQDAFSDIFNTIFNRLTTDETNINILSNSLGKTNTNLNTTNTNLTTTTNTLTATNNNLNSLSNRVSTTESNITTLSGDLAITKNNLDAL
mgnify:FL=1